MTNSKGAKTEGTKAKERPKVETDNAKRDKGRGDKRTKPRDKS